MGDADGVRIALWCQSHIARWRERLGHASIHAIAAPVLGGPEVLRARVVLNLCFTACFTGNRCLFTGNATDAMRHPNRGMCE